MALTKANLTNLIHECKPNFTKIKAREAVETILRIMKDSLASGDDILLSGFGKFNVKDKSARKGRNPKTGDPMMLDARRVVTFKPGGKLRQKVNGK
jgi:integration host factor subunit alpha